MIYMSRNKSFFLNGEKENTGNKKLEKNWKKNSFLLKAFACRCQKGWTLVRNCWRFNIFYTRGVQNHRQNQNHVAKSGWRIIIWWFLCNLAKQFPSALPSQINTLNLWQRAYLWKDTWNCSCWILQESLLCVQNMIFCVVFVLFKFLWFVT